MRWIPFVILLALLAVLQTTLAALVEVRGVRPDFILLTAAYYALAARRADALLACWLLGLAVDLNGLGFERHSGVGVHAFAYGLTALASIWLRNLTLRDHLLTYLGSVVFWTLLLHALTGLHLVWIAAERGSLRALAAAAAHACLYNLFLAPYAHGLFRRARTLLGLDPVRAYRVRR